MLEVSTIGLDTATLSLGGPNGPEIQVEATDALVLPTGTGDRSVRASDDFLMVGAYPQDKTRTFAGRRRAMRRGSVWQLCQSPTQILSRAPPGVTSNCGDNSLGATA